MISQEFKNILEMIDSEDETNIYLGISLLESYKEEFENYFNISFGGGIELISFLRFNATQGNPYSYHLRGVNIKTSDWKTNIPLSGITCVGLGYCRDDYKNWGVFHHLPSLKELIIDEWIDDLTNLTLFQQLESFSWFPWDNKSKVFPSSINTLINLKKLEINVNIRDLGGIPENIEDLINLEVLKLEQCSLESLPATIQNLTKLEELSLKNNEMKFLPEGVKYLRNLKKLDISHNKLVALPEGMQLFELRSLYLTKNRIKNLPNDFSELKRLKELDISHNEIHDLSYDHSGLKKLRTINLQNNFIKELPAWFENLFGLTRLYLSGNQITNLPKCVLQLNKLKVLKANNNQIMELSLIDTTSNLHELYLNNNQIKSVSDLAGLKKVKILELANNKITKIPQSIGQLKEMTLLNLSQNLIKRIPNKIGEAISLRFIDLKHNPIKILPSGMGSLKELNFINIALEDLTEISPKVTALPKLRKLNNTPLKKFLPYLSKKRNLRSVMDLLFNPEKLGQYYDAGIFLLKNLYSEEFNKQYHMDIKESAGVLALFSNPETCKNYSLKENGYLKWNGMHFKEITYLLLWEQNSKYFKELAKLTSLENLNIDFFMDTSNRNYMNTRHLDEVPKSIKHLKNLRKLSICGHHIKKISRDICELEYLEELSLNRNKIAEIPIEITKLKNLKKTGFEGQLDDKNTTKSTSIFG